MSSVGLDESGVLKYWGGCGAVEEFLTHHFLLGRLGGLDFVQLQDLGHVGSKRRRTSMVVLKLLAQVFHLKFDWAAVPCSPLDFIGSFGMNAEALIF